MLPLFSCSLSGVLLRIEYCSTVQTSNGIQSHEVNINRAIPIGNIMMLVLPKKASVIAVITTVFIYVQNMK